MKLETSINRQHEVAQAVREIFEMAKIVGLTSDEINLRLNKVKSERLKGAPRWVWSHVAGIEDQIRLDLYSSFLIFGAYVNGVFYSTQRGRSDYYEKHGISPRVFSEQKSTSGHYWSLPSGKIKPFHVSCSAIESTCRVADYI